MAKVSRYSSYRAMTAYEGVTAWQAKRKVMRQEFEAKQQAAERRILERVDEPERGLEHHHRPDRA